ncbi:MAG TPA: alkaline phosphatase D family protein [Actinopolymorphaceae bacterium]
MSGTQHDQHLGHSSDVSRPASFLERRQFVGFSGLAAFALAFSTRPTTTTTRESESFADYPFTLGVASGDPLPDSVILWTRLAPRPLQSDGGMNAHVVPVSWEVAADDRFRRVVRRGTAFARPEYVHAVHVDVRGLEPARDYYYRFKAGSQISPVGRTRTAPDPAAHPTQFRFAIASCQAWFDGFYTAYDHMAREDLDLVVHLGDYLYEYGVQTNGGRPGVQLPDKYYRQTIWLNDYRDRYALYKLDPHLQAAHARAPWLVTWDDHEVVNNYVADRAGAEPPEDFLIRRANAYRAYWEHMPLRPPQPNGPDLSLYRRFTFGDLIEFSMLDTRQYRDDQACGDGLRVDCPERLDPARTVLGFDQEAWLLDGFARSRARWNVLAQQLMMAQLDFDTEPGQAFSMDLWDGYKPARDRLLAGLVERRVVNPIVLSGDIHRNMAADIKQDFDDPDSPTIATEFIGTSISSGMDGADMDEFGTEFLAANPHVRFYNNQRGYVRFTVTPSTLQADYRALPYVRQEGAPVYTRASFVVEDGRPGLELVNESTPRGLRHSTDVEPPEPVLDDMRLRGER